MDGLVNELKSLQIGKVKEYEPLSNHTTIKIGSRQIFLLSLHQLII